MMLCRKKANGKKWAKTRNEYRRKWKIQQNHMHDYECSEVTATAITYTLRTHLIRNSLQAEHPDDYMMHIKFLNIVFGFDAHSRTEQSTERYTIWSLLWLEIIITRKKSELMKFSSAVCLFRWCTHYRSTSSWPCIFDAIWNSLVQNIN